MWSCSNSPLKKLMDNKNPQGLTEAMIKSRVARYLDIWVANLVTLYPISNKTEQIKPKIQVPHGAEFGTGEPESGEDSKWTFSSLDLSRGDFHFTSFKYLDMRHTDFSGSDLRFSQFIGCNLQGARFDNADLSWAQISECKLQGTSFLNCDCYDLTFIENETEIGVTGRVYVPRESHPLNKVQNFFTRPDPGKKEGKKINPFQLPGDFRPPHTAAYAYHQKFVRDTYDLSNYEIW